MSDFEWFQYPNRTVCSVLEEMRATKPNRHMSGLIEEVQTLVNRMESAMEDWSDIRVIHQKRKEARDEFKKEVEDRENATS